MRRIAWLLLLTIFLGCDSESTQQKSNPIPPDDMSNGPWKNQRKQGSGLPPAETPAPGEPD